MKAAVEISPRTLFYRKYRTEILLFTLWGGINILIFVWKYYAIAAKCNNVIHGPFSLFGDTPENAKCQASFKSCCKPYPYPDGPNLDPYYKPCDGGCDDACNLIGRVLGHLLNFNLALTLLPILRNSIWSRFFMKFPFERSVFFHRWIGLFIFITMLIHMATWWYTQPFPSEGWICWTFTFGFRSDQFNGQIAFLFHATAGLFALEYFRRKYFELFFFTHVLYLGVFAFAIWHTAGVQNYYGWDLVLNFEDDYFIYYLAVPFLMFVVDRLYRFYLSNFVKTKVVSVEQDNVSRITKLVLKRDRFQFASGQYCFICIPEISKLQWHPFSISSNPSHTDQFTFHIKGMGHGTWSEDLYQLARIKKSTFDIKVDGPYGAKGLLPQDYKVNVLFCGGIGATPMISILSELVSRHQMFSNTEIVYFHWVIKDKRSLSWFKALWLQIFNRDPQIQSDGSERIMIGKIEFAIFFHITQGSDKSPLVNYDKKRNNVINENNRGKDEDESQLLSVENMAAVQIEGLIPDQCFSTGRPHIKNIIQTIREENYNRAERIAIFSCGPKEMTDSIKIEAAINTDKRLRFDLHEETFYL